MGKYFVSLIAVIVTISSALFATGAWPIEALPKGAVARLGDGTIRDIAFSPDGKLLAVAVTIGVYLYDLPTLRERTLLRTNTVVRSIAFSPDGNLLAGVGGDTVWLWDVKRHQEVNSVKLKVPFFELSSVAFGPDGNMLACGGGSGFGDNWGVVSIFGKIKLLDVRGLQEIASLDDNGVTSVAFSPDGNLLAAGTMYPAGSRGLTSGSRDDTVKLWDVESHQEIATLNRHSDDVTRVAFSLDGSLLASGSSDDTVKLWNMVSHREIATLIGHSGGVFYFAYSGGVSCVAFSPDGSLLAGGSSDATVLIWDIFHFINP